MRDLDRRDRGGEVHGDLRDAPPPRRTECRRRAAEHTPVRHGGDDTCRKTALARRLAPRLVVEHGKCVAGCPLNTGASNGSRVSAADLAAQLPVLNCTDLLRTYDSVTVFSISEVLERQARLLHAAASLPEHAQLRGPAKRLLDGSGEPSVSAALGGVIQPMRSNIRGVPLPPAFLGYNGEGPHSRQLQHREDEIERLTLWARIARSSRYPHRK